MGDRLWCKEIGTGSVGGGVLINVMCRSFTSDREWIVNMINESIEGEIEIIVIRSGLVKYLLRIISTFDIFFQRIFQKEIIDDNLICSVK